MIFRPRSGEIDVSKKLFMVVSTIDCSYVVDLSIVDFESEKIPRKRMRFV